MTIVQLSQQIGDVTTSMTRVDGQTWLVACGLAYDIYDNRLEALDAYWKAVEKQNGWYDYEHGRQRDEDDATPWYKVGLRQAARFADEYTAACELDAAQHIPHQEELK